MNVPVPGSKYWYDAESGAFINGDHSRIAEIIRDYRSTLELRWIPPGQRDSLDLTPFQIVNVPNIGPVEPVMFLSEKEMDNPQLVLTRLFNSDNSRHGKHGVQARIESSERAKAILEAKAEMDVLEEKRDIAKSLFKSNLHTYNLNGKKLSL